MIEGLLCSQSESIHLPSSPLVQSLRRLKRALKTLINKTDGIVRSLSEYNIANKKFGEKLAKERMPMVTFHLELKSVNLQVNQLRERIRC